MGEGPGGGNVVRPECQGVGPPSTPPSCTTRHTTCRPLSSILTLAHNSRPPVRHDDTQHSRPGLDGGPEAAESARPRGARLLLLYGVAPRLDS